MTDKVYGYGSLEINMHFEGGILRKMNLIWVG